MNPLTAIAPADSDEHYLAMKLLPKRTGLPMAIWITERDSSQHDLRIKVSLLRGGKGRWNDAVPVSVRPEPKDITGALEASDFHLVCRWLELNRDTIIDFWNDEIDSFDVMERLRKLGD
jgi:hypothetical protein